METGVGVVWDVEQGLGWYETWNSQRVDEEGDKIWTVKKRLNNIF